MAAIGDEMPVEAATGDQTLADERRRRTQAAGSAIAAGILTFGGGLLAAVVYGDLPTVRVLDALRERLEPGAAQPGLRAQQVLWYDDNALELILVAVVLALAAVAIGLALAHLYRSTKARRPQLPPAVLYAAVGGAAFVAAAAVVQAIGLATEAAAFAGSSMQTSGAADDVFEAPAIVVAKWLSGIGVLTLGFAFVLLALNAMRAGLLTRFMGVLGIIVGVLFILPLGSSLPIVQAVWLLALGALFLGRWPAGLPPAWVTGEAQPWPTQQELREARTAQREGGRQERPRRSGPLQRPEPPETPAPEMPERRPHPSSKKRKRKRR